MPRQHVHLTKKDIREFVRQIEGINQDIQNLKAQRRSDATVRLLVSSSDTAIASDTVNSATEITSPTMIWDDPDRGWDFSEFKE